MPGARERIPLVTDNRLLGKGREVRLVLRDGERRLSAPVDFPRPVVEHRARVSEESGLVASEGLNMLLAAIICYLMLTTDH